MQEKTRRRHAGARSKRDTHELSPIRAQPLLRVEAEEPKRCPRIFASWRLPILRVAAREPCETRTSFRNALTVRTRAGKADARVDAWIRGWPWDSPKILLALTNMLLSNTPTHSKAKAGGGYAPPALSASYLLQRLFRPKHLAGLAEGSKPTSSAAFGLFRALISLRAAASGPSSQRYLSQASSQEVR